MGLGQRTLGFILSTSQKVQSQEMSEFKKRNG